MGTKDYSKNFGLRSGVYNNAIYYGNLKSGFVGVMLRVLLQTPQGAMWGGL